MSSSRSRSVSPVHSASRDSAGASGLRYQFPDLLSDRAVGRQLSINSYPKEYRVYNGLVPAAHFHRFTEKGFSSNKEELEELRLKALVADFLSNLPSNDEAEWYDEVRELFAELNSDDPLKCQQWDALAALWVFHSSDLGCEDNGMGYEAARNCLRALKHDEWPQMNCVAVPRLDKL